MPIQKKPATNILTACLALSIIFLLWRTFGTSDHISHTSGYHPTSLLLTKGQLQIRQIKPQTLPKQKVAHPLQARQQYTDSSTQVPPSNEQPLLFPSSDTQSAQTQSEPPPDQPPHAAPGIEQAGATQAESEAPPPLPVTCSQDMSRPCLLSQ